MGVDVEWLQLGKHAYAGKSYLLSKLQLLRYQNKYINIIIAAYFSFNEEKTIIIHEKKEGLTGVLANGLIKKQMQLCFQQRCRITRITLK